MKGVGDTAEKELKSQEMLIYNMHQISECNSKVKIDESN